MIATRSLKGFPVLAAAALAVASLALPAAAQVGSGFAFTYQGQLREGGQPATGLYDFDVCIFDAHDAPSALQCNLLPSEDIPVEDGLFSLDLDFGSASFDGEIRYLGLRVRPGDSGGDFTTLLPRQRLRPTPTALNALTAGVANLAQAAENAANLSGQSPSFYRDASNLNAGTVADARLGGNIPRLGQANAFTAPQNISATTSSVLGLASSATNGSWLNLGNSSTNGRTWNVIATGSGNGEGAGKLLIRDGSGNAVRATFDTAGRIGIGTTSPSARLEVFGADAQARIRNSNDPGGGFLMNSFGALQMGLYNPTASAWGAVPAAGQRSMLGMDNSGRVGTLGNTGLSPTWRNTLDDGSGNASISGNLSYANQARLAYAQELVAETQVATESSAVVGEVTVNVPAGSGFLLINGSVYSRIREARNDGSAPMALYLLTEVVGGNPQTLTYAMHFLSASGTSVPDLIESVQTLPISWVVPVTAAGPRTFRTYYNVVTGAEPAYYAIPSLNVLYVPSGL